MTKLELAIKEAEKLSPDEQERLGDDLLHYIHKMLALRADIAIGVDQLERGDVVAGDVVLAKLRARYGA
jgi:hypothetical protein